MKTDDPRLTAYVLGELNPSTRDEFEKLLASDPTLEAEARDLEVFGNRLRDDFRAEKSEPLPADRRVAILGAAGAPGEVERFRPWWKRPIFGSIAAACAVMGAIATIFLQQRWVTAPRTLANAPDSEMRLPVNLTVESESKPREAPVESNDSPDGSLKSLGTIADASRVSGLAELPALHAEYREDNFSLNARGLVTPRDLPVQAEPSPVPSKPIATSLAGRMGGSASGEGKRIIDLAASAGRQNPHWDAGTSRHMAGPALFAGAPAVRAIDWLEADPPEGFGAQIPGATETYDAITDNPFLAVKEQPLSTFSIDVDTASYANVRRFLNTNQLPPKGAVRIEELVNYFNYDYPQPQGDDPFSCALEVAVCPWQPEHRLARIGLKGKTLAAGQRPPANLVFLVDVSGSMQPANKLPLAKESLRLLLEQLGEEDSVAIAVYAGASGCVLEPTRDRAKIRAALDRLESGGSTNGAAGIQLAYDLAQRAFKKDGANRVILLTDGDFNVGITDQSQLVSLIEGKAKTGIFLSVLGFGMGNLKDSTLEKLADKGNGNYAYIDTISEGRRVFVEQVAGTLFTIAKDVKVQVEFNPAQVAAYRLIGYENRLLAKEDFNDDTKDAGEIGAGHGVTALYEIVPAGAKPPAIPPVDELKYRQPPETPAPAIVKPASGELLTVKLRYKQPDGDVSKKLEFPLTDRGGTWEASGRDFRWASAVAGFGMMLRDSPHKGAASWALIEELAAEGRGEDRDGYRAEFVGLIEKASALSR